MTNSERTAKQRFDELVLWYVNGTLDEESKDWVERYLRDHPDARHELSWHRELRGVLDIRHMKIPGDVGLYRLLEQVNAEEKSRSTLFERIRSLFAEINARRAFAVAVVIVVAQAIALGFLVKELKDQEQLISGYSATRAAGNQRYPDMPALQVTFKSLATEREIRLLLIQIQGRIIDGPRQLGDYTVSVPPERLKEAQATLKKSDIVEVVLLQQSRPTSD